MLCLYCSTRILYNTIFKLDSQLTGRIAQVVRRISHTLPTTRHRCNLGCVGLGAKPRRWTPLTRDTRKILSEYNKDLIFF